MAQTLEGIYNTSAFDGTVESDFIKLGIIPDALKADLIDYSVADFDDYRQALTNYLRAVYPLDYNNFIESDLGIMMMEMFSYLAATLSLKADMTANELYLPTVKSTNNLRKLLQLIGVSLKGPTSSRATAMLTSPNALNESNDTLTVLFGNRTFSIPSNKDSEPLSYTIYKYDTDTGKVDLEARDIILQDEETVDSSKLLFNNVILLEGEIKETTGTFEDTQSIKTISITDSGVVEGSLVVSADDGTIYHEIENVYLASGATDKVFQKVYDSNYAATLVFGDGARGKAPVSNQAYRVLYRVGGGERGNIPSNYINVSFPATHSDDGIVTASIQNITRATGGFNAETVDHAKRYAPYTFKTQYRAVTGEDYTTYINNFISTAGQAGKGISVLRDSGAGANMIDVYVVSKASDRQVERSSIVYKQELLSKLNSVKMLTDEITIVDGLVRTLDLVVTVFVDKSAERFEEDIKRKANAKILSYFNVANREFGERFELSRLNRALYEISEIRFSKVDNLNEDIRLNFNEILQLNNAEINVEYV
jgi:hypothetical protein